MLEKTVEKELCDRVKSDLGGWALKFVSPGQNGVPDRVILVPGGRIYFVETKAPGKKLRRLQEHVCGLITQLGFKAADRHQRKSGGLCKGGTKGWNINRIITKRIVLSE